jgi:multicomponent K+:H+ antiporter subunit G
MTALWPALAQWLAAALIVMGSLLALAAALGVAFLKNGFQRLHPPALASTGGAWCLSAAAMVYFSASEHAPALYVWLIPILLSITTPVSTLLIARAVLFRRRQAGDPGVPPPLQAPHADIER